MLEKIKKVKKNKELLFCYLLIGGSILFALLIFIIKPNKLDTTALYDYAYMPEVKEVNFPLVQQIKIEKDNLVAINLYLGESNINEYDYIVRLTDKDGNSYYEENFSNYNSNVISMNLGNMENSQDFEFSLTIDCETCSNISLDIGKSINKDNYIVGTDKDVLKLEVNNYSVNNSYYWYSFLGIVIGLTLLPLTRGDKHER